MHDARKLGESGLMEDLSQYAFAPDGTPLCLYGDPAMRVNFSNHSETILQ